MIKKVPCNRRLEYGVAIKRNRLLINVRRLKPKCLLPSEGSQTQKAADRGDGGRITETSVMAAPACPSWKRQHWGRMISAGVQAALDVINTLFTYLGEKRWWGWGLWVPLLIIKQKKFEHDRNK